MAVQKCIHSIVADNFYSLHRVERDVYCYKNNLAEGDISVMPITRNNKPHMLDHREKQINARPEFISEAKRI